MKINEVDVEGYDTILLDRDGTINVHIIDDYVRKWDDFEFIPNVKETISHWTSVGKEIYIVTNQRGIGKGKYTDRDLADIHARMVSEIEKVGGRINGIYYCSALTNEDIRRKPGRGMFDEILHDYPEVNPKRTIMIGDSDVDRDFAENCNIAFQCVDSLKRDGEYKYWVKTTAPIIINN